MQVNTATYDKDGPPGYSSDKLRLRCFPKLEKSAGIRSSHNLRTLGFGAVLLVMGAMVLG